MDYFKVIGSILFIFVFLNVAESKTGNCTAVKGCKSCLNYNGTDCFWCASTGLCMKKDGILPKGCKSVDWRYYDNCSVPGYVWVIVIPVICCVILIALGCFFYCCCCRCKTSKRGAQNEETKFHRKRMELKAKHAERRAERKLKTDEIRRKYGLDKDDGSSASRYHQFENEPEA